MSSNDLTPYETIGVYFDPSHLTATEKEWLTKQVIDGNMTSAQVALKYKIRRVRVANWVHRYRSGHTSRSFRGRSRALDKIALVGLQEWLEECGSEGFDAEKSSKLKEHLNEAYRDTRKRRRSGEINIEDDCDVKMCRGTMINYINYVKNNKIDEMIARS